MDYLLQIMLMWMGMFLLHPNIERAMVARQGAPLEQYSSRIDKIVQITHGIIIPHT
jgi:hypothetical protein